jgi:hypothetical protein
MYVFRMVSARVALSGVLPNNLSIAVMHEAYHYPFFHCPAARKGTARHGAMASYNVL